MSRSKARKKHHRHPGASAEETPIPRYSRVKLTVAAVAVIAAAGAAWSWWDWYGLEAGLSQGANQGLARLNAVESFPSEGTVHLRPGERVFYRTAPPTSGSHDSVPTPPGFYSEVQPPEKLVHALEHGNIVVYIDQPASAVLQILRKWADHYSGRWDGVIVTAYPGLKQSVVLTAWQHRLRVKEFDTAAATAFIDRFRGRGPENPVR